MTLLLHNERLYELRMEALDRENARQYVESGRLMPAMHHPEQMDLFYTPYAVTPCQPAARIRLCA